jgi:hypothetical protein
LLMLTLVGAGLYRLPGEPLAEPPVGPDAQPWEFTKCAAGILGIVFGGLGLLWLVFRLISSH